MSGSKQIISFSLFGREHNRPFFAGALANVIEARRFYPGWFCRFYVGPYVTETQRRLLVEEGAEVVGCNDDEGWRGLFWRFLAAGDPEVSVFLSRDTDSRFTDREVAAVREWLDSGRSAHVMRDHPYHNVPMLGGMWGVRGGVLPDIADLIAAWPDQLRKGTDQDFLGSIVYPRIAGSVMAHDEFFAYEADRRPFPTKRVWFEFAATYLFSRDITERTVDPLLRAIEGKAKESR